jgi:CRP-like cAMP-binding protein
VSDAFAALDAILDPGAQRPCLAPDVELVRFTSPWQGVHAVLHNPRERTYIRLSGVEAELIASLDGTRDVRDLTAGGLTDGGLQPDLIAELVAFLHRGGFLTAAWVDTYALLTERTAPPSTRSIDRAWRRMRTMTIEFPGAGRFVNAVYQAGGRLLFTGLAQVVLLVILVSGVAAFVVESQTRTYTVLGRPTTATAATLFVLGLVALFFHELGHGLAIRRAERRILGAGFQLYLLNPVFFIDSSDMVMAGRKERAVNAIAGPYAQAVVGSVAALGAWASPNPSLGHVLFRFAALTFVFTLVNFVPFLELDGYWLLTDLLDVPDLRPRSLAFLRYDLADRLRSRRKLGRGEWGLALFGVFGVAFTVVALVLGWVFWWPYLRAFATGLWDLGLAGKILLALLALLVLGPLAHGLGDATRSIGRWTRAQAAAARFRAERGWRVKAGAMIAALPQTADLSTEDLNDVAGRVRRRQVSAGEAIVRQGDPPDAFYLIRRGRCAVIEEAPGGGESVIARLDPGATFGELALLEGTPRSATVRAESPAEVLEVDIATFQRILAGTLALPRLAPSAWPVTRVWALAPFRNLTLAAATELAANGAWLRVAPGEDVVREGEIGDTFYVVSSGQLDALRDGAHVGSLRAGDFFGEVALLHDAPRTATVRARTPARLFALPRRTFDQLLRASFDTGRLAPHPTAHTHSARVPRRP